MRESRQSRQSISQNKPITAPHIIEKSSEQSAAPVFVQQAFINEVDVERQQTVEPTSDYDELPLKDLQRVLVVNKMATDLDSTDEANAVTEEKRTYIID